jgi:hypothetical protein
LLLVAAALLTASMHSLGVVETPVAPEPTHAVVQTVAADRGDVFLRDLATLPPAELRTLSRRAAVRAMANDEPPASDDVLAWWAGLDAATRDRLELDAPDVVGELDGVPYDVRDRANRLVLARVLAHDTASPTAERAMAEQVRRSLERSPGDPDKQLVVLDLRGAGRAAIAIGDLGTAADVTVVVPGMFFTVTGQMVDFTATAGDLYREQASLAPVARGGEGSGVAVLAWMGYRTPDLSNVLSLDLADTGARRLERIVGGLQTVRGAEQPRVTVVAHSYGSTTALTALASGRMHVDGLTLIGSPGSSVANVSQLAVADHAVYVGDAHWDPVAGTGYFGTDPGSAGFGSTLLDLATAIDADGDVHRQPVGHNDYLKPGTSSLHDVALVAVGRGDLVGESGGSGSDDSSPTSPDFLVVRPQDLQARD